MIDVRNLIERVGGDVEYREFNRSVGAPAVARPILQTAALELAADNADEPAAPAAKSVVQPAPLEAARPSKAASSPRRGSLLNRYAAQPAPVGILTAVEARTAPLADIFQILEGRGGALRKSA